jgi:phage tail-like protein
MDVNQTRFHLVYGQADWFRAPAAAGSPAPEPLLDWNKSDATLSLHQELFVFPRPAAQAPLVVEERRGSGRDRYGNWYWIGTGQNEIRFLGAFEKVSEHFWSAADMIQPAKADSAGGFSSPQPAVPANLVMSGLAVTTDHYLVVGLTTPKGLLIFDLHEGGRPLQYLWPDNVAFSPFAIAAARDGGVRVLDRVNKAYWHLDRYFRVYAQTGTNAGPQQSTFQPVNGKLQPAQMQCLSRQITPALAMPLNALSDPVAIQALPGKTVVILDNPPAGYFSVVYQYRLGVQTAPPQPLDQALAGYMTQPLPPGPHPAAVRGYDMAFVPNPAAKSTLPGTLAIAAISGEQVFEFNLKPQPNAKWLELVPQYFPMRRFGAKAILAGDGTVYYDFEDRWPPLVAQPRARFNPEAALVLPNPGSGAGSPDQPAAFDGKQLGCIWHRVLVDACIPQGAHVTIESRAVDQKSLLPSTPWQPEPAPYLRDDGPEIPFYRSPLTGPADRVGTWELLFQKARGRYLQLRLTLSGTGRNTPRLNALRVYYPRFSYLRQYLPAVYRDDVVSASFLDRFLANVEGFYTVLEGKIEQVQTLFDTRTIPAEYLDWLGSWLGLTLDLGWSEATRRLVVSHGPQMFRQRGTRNGMIRAIRLALDPCPDESLFQDSVCSYNCPGDKFQSPFTVRVIERFLTRNAPGVVYGNPTDVLGPGSTTASSDWTPAQGAKPLHQRFRDYLSSFYGDMGSLNTAWGTIYTSFDDISLPPVQPSQKTQAADWNRFLQGSVGFTYAAVTADDLEAYQDFLSRQYPSISDLNTAYNLSGSNTLNSFEAVQLPDTFPPSGRALQDWIQFVSVVLPTARNAHRFTVLVPVTTSDDPNTQLQKLAIAQNVALLEKPAHTIPDVRLYWGMFRVGEARVGLDTFLGQSSRSVAIVLGRDYLSAGHLAFVEPWNVTDRMTIARSNAAEPSCGRKPQERCT